MAAPAAMVNSGVERASSAGQGPRLVADLSHIWTEKARTASTLWKVETGRHRRSLLLRLLTMTAGTMSLLARPKLANSFEFLRPSVTSPKQVHQDAPITVRKPSSWSYIGPQLDPAPCHLPDDLLEWLRTCVDGEVSHTLTAFLEAAHGFLQSHGLQHYCLTIRATNPTTDYDNPRWHTDTIFFQRDRAAAEGKGWIQRLSGLPSLLENDGVTDWKLCTTLSGPSTLFVPERHQSAARRTQRETKQACATDHVCTSIRCLGCATSAEAVRDRLAEQLDKLGYVQAHTGQCTVFRVGHDGGAVHSEPPMSSGDRIFVNIVPGTEEEVRKLAWQWGMEYPRSWVHPSSIGLQQQACACPGGVCSAK